MAEYHFNSAAGEVAPDIIDGPPPSQQIATLTAERDAALAANQPLQDRVAALETFIRTEYVSPAQARKDADAATVDGQAELDKAQALGITP